MKIRRWALLAVSGAVLAAASACAPGTAAKSEPKKDEQTGTVKVWLYNEAKPEPKTKVVDAAVAEFKAQHPGVTVEVSYIPTDAGPRAEKMKGAFNDPNSAPDVVEFGNTDLFGYVAAGGLADIGADLAGWSEAGDLPKDLKDTALVNGVQYGMPWWLGIRSLYYRTDVFTELGIKPPTSYAELVEAATKVRAAKPDLFGIAVGGKYTFGALPFVWAAGGDLATQQGQAYTAAVGSPQAQAGVKAYTDLFTKDICPAEQCVDMTGGKTVEAFAAGKAGMAILPNSSRSAVEAGAVKDKYGVVPLPGTAPGSIAPAFSGGNDLGVMKSSPHRSLAVDFIKLLAGKKYQLQMFDAMGNLPTLASARADVVAKDAFLKPFMQTLDAGTRFVPKDAAWAKIDAQTVVPTMLQKVITGKADVAGATSEAATAMNAAFSGK
ncbi:extracellular solute-binding protein [Yinghuangia seranimata]|uniref:extracellular solute-binding protein n=1 Tax=Yinghuangia seranimata TaxID=408067 RepID=UPI00248AE899|nr:extracellular solute-binding protein [Yinghuangia seranimata]MDI2132810.1 extracellular solute-binding protein [Yinghuangia seranimata]